LGAPVFNLPALLAVRAHFLPLLDEFAPFDLVHGLKILTGSGTSGVA
jgi:hypothetical protein